MEKRRKDGEIDQRQFNKGVKGKAGAKSKAEQMRLLERLNKTYHKSAKRFALGSTEAILDAPDAVLKAWWDIILDPNTKVEHKMKALEVVGNRFFGKEPRAVLTEEATHGTEEFDPKEIFGNTFEDGEDTTKP